VVAATKRGRILPSEIATLVDRRLLRIEHHLGTERVELTHDLLTRAALERRSERQAAERSAALRRWMGRVGAAVMVVVAVVGFLVWQEVDRLQSKRATEAAAAKKDRDRLAEIELANEKLREAQAGVSRANAALEARNADLLKTYEQLARASLEARTEAENAKQQRAVAEQLSMLARSREVAARALSVMANDRELAVLLGAEALRIADTPEARAALLDAARYAWPTTVLAPDQLGGPPRLVGLDARGRQLVVVAESRTQIALSMWDLDSRAPTKPRWQRTLDPATVGFVTFMPDGSRLLVARPDRIDRLDTQTGEPAAPSIDLPAGSGKNTPPTQIAVSINGQWLAVAMPSGAALVRGLRETGSVWETAAKQDAEGISISEDGQRIATVSGTLRPAVLERDGAGNWTSRPLDVTACATLQSVATAPSYAVATWRAQSCSQSLKAGEIANSTPTRTDEAAIADTVASAFGPAFVAILANGDLKVGTGDPSRTESTSEVKGVNLGTRGNMLSDVSINANGTRVAWLSEKGVHVVSLAGYKLLVTDYPRGMVAVEDGLRVVQARAVRDGARVWMTPVAAVSEGRELPRAAWSPIPLPRLPERLEVRGDAVVIAVPGGGRGELGTTTVHDLVTGRVRAGPFPGESQAAGPEGRLLFVRSPPNAAGSAETALIRLSDGRALGRWPEGVGHQVLRSAAGTALLVVQPAGDEPHTLVAQAYAIDGERLVPAGRVVGLPATSIAVDIDDAATVLTEERQVPATEGGGTSTRPRRATLRWPLSPGRETLASVAAQSLGPPPARPPAPEIRSPSGRLVWRQLRQPDSPTTTVLVRRDDGAVVHRSPHGSRPDDLRNASFSSDERWFAFVEEESGVLHVLDLRTFKPVLNWALDAKSASFTRGGRFLHVKLREGAELLVPTDRALLDGFARWLVSRELQPDERCRYGLDATSCGDLAAPKSQRKNAAAGQR
jgi:hypothetical protein